MDVEGVVEQLTAVLSGWRVAHPELLATVARNEIEAGDRTDVYGRADVAVRVGGRLRLVAVVRRPDDTMSFLSWTKTAYRRAGVLLVWDIDPDERVVQIDPLGGRPSSVNDAEELTGGDALPGCRVPVARLFE